MRLLNAAALYFWNQGLCSTIKGGAGAANNKLCWAAERKASITVTYVEAPLYQIQLYKHTSLFKRYSELAGQKSYPS